MKQLKISLNLIFLVFQKSFKSVTPVFQSFVKIIFDATISISDLCVQGSFKEAGLISLDHTHPLFLEYLPHDSFEGLKIPLTIAVTDFSEGRLVYFSSGKLIQAIIASSSIPLFFKPYIIGGKMYVDGGLLNNFPVEPLRSDCDFIIGSSCNHLPVVDTIVNYRKLIERTTIMSINADMEMKRQYCDVLIEPEGMGATSIFDVKKTEEIYWLSYEATLRKLQTDLKLKKLLNMYKT